MQLVPPSFAAMDGFGDNSFKLDEGFSETQDDHVRNMSASTAASFQTWLMSQSDQVRADVAYEILRTLRTSSIASVVERLTPLLHMDPIEKLPPEITAEVFSYLDASTLLTASLASTTWRERILDPRLWQQLYKSQGWGVDEREVKAFEDAHVNLVKSEFSKVKEQSRASRIVKGQPLLKRRATSDWLDSTPRQVSADVAQWREQHGVVEADTDVKAESDDHEMPDLPSSTQGSPSRPNKRHSHDSGDEMDYYKEETPDFQDMSSYPSQFQSGLLCENEDGESRFNWQHLYKQRHKLEDNWIKGRFTNFQLPHPDYPGEAHTECVYTIQFYGKWLVSGSRDKTLRVWDLETRRLRGKPLTGHSQSVLCLQFDPTEEEDIVISGSSDSSIIVWKFSTGQKLHTIQSAHEESVLNLRFDHRYLVTCSKDKKIKVWNRRSLTPLDPDYPSISENPNGKTPAYIININEMPIPMMEAKLADGSIRALKPYTQLITLEGHSAAVNAIQIHGDLIVSASGDRLIRIWNVKNGSCLKVVPGHQKGIACVQFDSKRIVSGSSDNTVRIYDPATGTEVAVLLGHTNLVRTVQAGFGDIPGSEEEYPAAARAAELKYQHDLEAGLIVDDRHYSRRRRNGEFGSSRVAQGSKLPPGGGGSKWGRIVSGSYDESIIIWKKDAHGHWVVGQTLRQEAAVRASIEADAARTAEQRQHRSRSQAVNPQVQVGAPSTVHHPTRVRAPQPIDQAQTMTASQIVQHAMNASMAGLQSGIQNVVGLTRGLNAPLISNMNVPARSSSAVTGGNNGVAATSLQSALNQVTSHAQAVAHNAIAHAVANNSTAQAMTGPTQVIANTAGGPVTSTVATASNVHPPPQQTPTPQAQQNNNQQVLALPHLQPVGQTHANQGSVSRVFKLQFDARRIVCCSQDSRIIGWDFANGDAEIMECCPFFIGP